MRGPVAGFAPLLQPAVHALLQVKEDIEGLASRVPAEHVWERPGGAAAIGFHVRHIGGSLDRLLTYARGEVLTAGQFAALSAESTDSGEPLAQVAGETAASIERVLDQLRATPPDALLTPRKVGRAGLPSTTIGLIFHAAEHATRHAGQAITTAKILSALKGVSREPQGREPS
jgi:hypothetical protein